MSEALDKLAIEEALRGRAIGGGESEQCRCCRSVIRQGQPATIRVNRSADETRWTVVGIWGAGCTPAEIERSPLGVESALVEIHVALGAIDQRSWTQVARPRVIDMVGAREEGGGTEPDVDVALLVVEGQR
jgi:hypothetical protein